MLQVLLQFLCLLYLRLIRATTQTEGFLSAGAESSFYIRLKRHYPELLLVSKKGKSIFPYHASPKTTSSNEILFAGIRFRIPGGR